MTDQSSPTSNDLSDRLASTLGWVGPLWRHRSSRIGVVLFLFIALGALAAPLSPYSPTDMHILDRFAPPLTAGYLLGTDEFGRDLLTRILYGAQVSMVIGLGTAVLSAVSGMLIGLAAAQFRAFDAAIMKVMDGLMAFPALVLAMALAAALGPNITGLIIALSLTYMPRTARLVRASALVVRELEFVESAWVSGAGSLRVMFRHLLPNCLSPMLVQATFVFAYAVLAEASLSFVGVGPPPPFPSWGNLIADGRDYVFDAGWVMLFPGIAISLSCLSLNLIGDGLRDTLDPRLKVES